MTTSISGTTLTYPDGTTQTVAATSGSPSWANVTTRPGPLPTSGTAPFPVAQSGQDGNTWYHAGVTWGRNIGSTGNCGAAGSYGAYSYLYLPQAGYSSTTAWDLYYATLNCYDCNCDCNCDCGGIGGDGGGGFE